MRISIRMRISTTISIRMRIRMIISTTMSIRMSLSSAVVAAAAAPAETYGTPRMSMSIRLSIGRSVRI